MKQTAKRDFTTHIALILFTFSVYYFVWIYQMTAEMNALENEKKRTPLFQLVLCLIPGYQIYWFYQSALRLDRLDDRKDAVNYVLLSIFLGAAASILMQDRINALVEKRERTAGFGFGSEALITPDRFQKLAELPANYYAEGAPVLLRGGALLKDLQTEDVVLQLSFENISAKSIRALMVGIEAFDILERPLEGIGEYQYLDLKLERGCRFGEQTAILLPDRFTRSVRVSVKGVLFEDGLWSASESGWENLTQFAAADFAAADPEFHSQWIAEFGEDALYTLQEHKDLWQCVCGALNRKDEGKCFACGRPYAMLKENSPEKIEEKKKARLAREEEARHLMLKEKADAIRATDLKPTVKLTWLLETLELLNRYEDVTGEIEDCREQLQKAGN